MGVTSVAEILIMNAQFLSMTANTNYTWPDEWLPYIHVLQIFTFNFWGSFQFFGINSSDSRAQHLIITNIIPIILCLIILFCFRSVLKILRYGITILGVCGLVLGIILTIFGGGSGLPIVFVCGFVLILLSIEYWMHKRREKRKIEEKINNAVGSTVDLDADEIDLEKFKFLKGLKFVHKKGFWRQLRNTILGLLMFIVGASLFSNIGRGSGNGPLFIVISISGILLIYNVISNMSDKGRKFNTKVNYKFRKDIVKIILTIFGLLYVPITLSTFRFVFSSATFDSYVACENNQIHNMKMPFEPFTGGSRDCISAVNGTMSTNIPIDFSNFGIKSNILTEKFLTLDKTILYYSEILPYFVPGCILSILVLTIGMPILYYKLIKTCAKYVHEIPVLAVKPENQWVIRAAASRNCCRSIYAMYRLKWRDYKLISLIYRLIVVCIVTFAGVDKLHPENSARIVFIILMAVHSIALCITLYSRPHIKRIEDILSIVCQSLNILNCFIAVLLSSGVYVSPKLVLPVILLTTLLPIFAIFFGLYLDARESKRMAKNMEHHIKLTKHELREKGPEGDLSRGNVELAEYLNIEKEELINMDMVIDKKLQDVLVYYSILFVIVSGLSVFSGIAAISNPIYAYKLVNSDNYAIGMPLDASLYKDSFNIESTYINHPSRSKKCQNLATILQNNCTCVDIPGVINKSTEAWKCKGDLDSDSYVMVKLN